MLRVGFNHNIIASPKRPDALAIYETKGNIPLYNTRATVIPCLDTDYVFVFGGFDELDNLDSNVYLLNMVTKTWEIDDKHIGLYREGHLAAYIGHGNVIVFGGIPHDEFPESTQNTSGSSDSTFRKDNLMMIYNVHDRKWIGPPNFALDNAPSSRYRHACCLSPDCSKVYISGGLVNSMPLDDLYSYDLISGIWKGPIKFVSRFDHYIRVHDNKIFTFGGLDKDMNHVIDCMTYLSLSDQSIGKVSLLLKPVFNEMQEEINDLEFINEYPHPGSGGSDFERIYTSSLACPMMEIEVCIPLVNAFREYNISYYDLENFQYTPLINRENIELILDLKKRELPNTYIWKHAFLTNLNSLFLLGLKIEFSTSHEGSENLVDVENDNDDEDDMTTLSERDEDNELAQGQDRELDESTKLHSLLEIKLSDLGLSKSEKNIPSLADDFINLLTDEKFSDFEIITFRDDSVMDEHNKFPDKYIDVIDKAMTNQTIPDEVLKSIKVHKSILLARWNHFRRLIDSGMNEALSNKMFIPEPYSWVRGLLFYLYTDTINFREPCTLADYSGILILSNLYEIPQLRVQVLFYLYRKLNGFVIEADANDLDDTIGTVLKIWTNALISNEEILVAKIVELIRNNWPVIIKSKPFMNLPKSLIIRLCQNCVDIFPSVDSKDPINSKHNTNVLSHLANIGADRDSDDSTDKLHLFTDSNLGTPTSGNVRESNSPFLKTANKHSLLKTPLFNSNELVDFPTLQFLSNVLNDKIQD